MTDFSDLMGKPYKLHGRGPDCYDCYGAVIELESRLGHTMIDLKRAYRQNNEKELDDNVYNIIKASGLRKTTELSFGNVILFYDGKGRCCHIGVYLKDEDYFHCDIEGCRISKLSDSERKWGVYEWLG